MAAAMIRWASTWLHNPAQREHHRGAWFEQARLSTFTCHSGVPTADGPAACIDFDDEDARRVEHNAWLARIDQAKSQ